MVIEKYVKALMICALLSDCGLAQGINHSFVPQQGKLIIIGQQQDAIDGYISNVAIPGGIMTYTSIQDVDGLVVPVNHNGGVMNAQYYIDGYPHMVVQMGLYMVGALDDTLEGRYDRNLSMLAQWMKNVGCPIYLRIGYEFDLPGNGYDPRKYRQAYRYVVDHLRALGVDNVSFVWHSACLVEPHRDVMDWYPGDDYVDWFGVSIFNPIQIGPAKEFFAVARRHAKSVMIAESAPLGLVTTRAKKEWFAHYFDFIDQDNVRVVSYINSDWDSYPLFQSKGWGDTRIENDPQIKDMWQKRIYKGFLQYPVDLSSELSV